MMIIYSWYSVQTMIHRSGSSPEQMPKKCRSGLMKTGNTILPTSIRKTHGPGYHDKGLLPRQNLSCQKFILNHRSNRNDCR